VVKWRAASLIVTKYATTPSVTLATYTVNRREGLFRCAYDHLLVKMITDYGNSRNGIGFSIAAITCDFFKRGWQKHSATYLAY
jgi:hypothetical protein